MTLQIFDEKIPLAVDESGMVRVAGTRVTLDCVVEMFRDGASPEEIVEEYDALELDDVYAVITYCLRHQQDVDDYLLRQLAAAPQEGNAIEDKFPSSLREKLLRAKHQREARAG